ncbi:MAG: mechanosensitive ion channel family protein, partial [Myxococcota bacterium]
RRGILRALYYLAERTPTKLDDYLVNRKVFRRMAWLAPLLVAYYGVEGVGSRTLSLVVQRFVTSGIVGMMFLTVGGALSALHDMYVASGRERRRPLKGYAQVANLVLYLVGGIIVMSVLVDRSPWALLSGLGAATAILLLVFRDTILSFVASIQIASNDTLRVGDWVSMPKYDADGDVIDIALNVVRVQNWDKSITSIPTHRFLDESFRNWRGMFQSGGRRIKRAVHVDQRKVRFVSEEERIDWAKLPGLDTAKLSAPRLTNMRAYREYVTSYLERHPATHEGMTLLVRELQPNAHGLPLEIYLFSRDQRWEEYERIQADIVEHLLAMLPSFDLAPFQYPTGADFETTPLAASG